MTSSARIVEPSESLPILERVNWSFSSPFKVGRSGTELFDPRKHHWFPATFIPEIPYTLIDVLSRPGASVYDPFSGIGTTACQAYMLGRHPFGTEITEIAVRVSRSFLTLLASSSDYSSTWSKITRRLNEFSSEHDYIDGLEELGVDGRFHGWYNPDTLNEVAFLTHLHREFVEVDEHLAQRATFVALSATLKAVCAQKRGWGCIADNVAPSDEDRAVYRDGIERFRINVKTMLRDLKDARNSKAYLETVDILPPDEHILWSDARDVPEIEQESIDIVITSPPYPEMTDYSYSQRLTYYWLGKDPKGNVSREIGARRKRSRKSSVPDYTDELQDAVAEAASKVKPGGYMCFVLPKFSGSQPSDKDRRRDRAVTKSVGSLLQLGFDEMTSITRNLPKRRRHHNQKWTSLEKELIQLYRRISA